MTTRNAQKPLARKTKRKNRQLTARAGGTAGNSNTPAYQRVANHVHAMVHEGQLAPGSMLPSERALASEFGVCHLTVRKGLAMLVDQGLIERQVGQGTFVADVNKLAASRLGTGDSSKLSSVPTIQGNAIALCVVESKSEMPTMGYALNGVRKVFGAGPRPLEIIEFPAGGCTAQFWEMLGDRVQGIIVQGYLSATDIAALRERNITFVSVGFQIGSVDAPWVSIDFDDMLGKMVQEAYRFGHKSVGMVDWSRGGTQRAPDHATPPSHEAFRCACRRFGMLDSVDRIYHLPDVDWPDASLVDTRPVLDALAALPSTLIVTDEVMASALLRDFEARGVRVPEDLSLVCMLDSTPNAHKLPLSGVDVRTEYMAIYKKAAKLLQSMLDGQELSSVRLSHQCTVDFKASMAPAKKV